MKGKVYTITTNDETEVNAIQRKYKVISINRGVENTQLRIISDICPININAVPTEARFEDVYMFYIELEDAREV